MRKIATFKKIAQIEPGLDPDQFSDEDLLPEREEAISINSPEDRAAVASGDKVKEFVLDLTGGSKEYEDVAAALTKVLSQLDVDKALSPNEIRNLAGNYALWIM